MSSSDSPIRLTMPFDRAQLADLRAGDACLLSGPMYTLRDAGHMRLLAELEEENGRPGSRGQSDRSEQPEQPEQPGNSEQPEQSEQSEQSDQPDGPGLPYGLAGQAIFYAGPTPPAAGRPFGAIGPTTASRMDFAAPLLHDLGVAATIGKGVRSAAVHDACVRNGAVYFVTVGGGAAYLAKCVRASSTIAYDDLGTEALRRIEVEDFPVFVGIDVHGNDVYGLA